MGRDKYAWRAKIHLNLNFLNENKRTLLRNKNYSTSISALSKRTKHKGWHLTTRRVTPRERRLYLSFKIKAGKRSFLGMDGQDAYFSGWLFWMMTVWLIALGFSIIWPRRLNPLWRSPIKDRNLAQDVCFHPELYASHDVMNLVSHLPVACSNSMQICLLFMLSHAKSGRENDDWLLAAVGSSLPLKIPLCISLCYRVVFHMASASVVCFSS